MRGTLPNTDQPRIPHLEYCHTRYTTRTVPKKSDNVGIRRPVN